MDSQFSSQYASRVVVYDCRETVYSMTIYLATELLRTWVSDDDLLFKCSTIPYADIILE